MEELSDDDDDEGNYISMAPLYRTEKSISSPRKSSIGRAARDFDGL